MPAGIASIVLQFQAFISLIFTLIFLKEKLKAKQMVGSLISILGLMNDKEHKVHLLMLL